MRVGITIDGTNGDAAGQAQAAERAGFDFVACGEHLFFHGPTPNAFITLATAAGATQRVRLMSALTLLALYPPALAAKLAASLDVASGGRFELGVGVGGEYPAEFEAAGVPHHERGKRTDAGLRLITHLLEGRTTPNHLSLDPPPIQRPRPPILVGGRREPAQRRAGRYADAWMPYLVTPEQLASGLAHTQDIAAAHGRPPVGGAVYLWTAIDEDGRRARRIAVDAVSHMYQQDFEPYADKYLVAGDPDTVVRRAREYAEAGAERVLISPVRTDTPGAPARMTALLAGHVLPALTQSRL